MASVHANVFSEEELYSLNNHPDVLAAKASLNASGKVYFTVPITDSIRTTLESRWGVRVEANLPMRWIQGDTAPHVDVGPSKFKTTYLVYLNDSPGEFIVDSQCYPIQANVGFSFDEGLSHETQNTGNVPRLLLGPMNESVEAVGLPPTVTYFSTQADALLFLNPIGFSYSYTVGPDVPVPYTSWRIASNSTGISPQNLVYVDGASLDPAGSYYLYPAAPCFLEGSTILCQVDGLETYVPVENLQRGTLVKTSLDGFKPVVLLGKGTLQNPGDDARIENRLYKCTPSHYPDLTSDLYLTGGHSILEFPITEKQKEASLQRLGKLYVTDKKYRVMACDDERAEPWNSEGKYRIWHFALDHHDEGMNYGVYANGLLVETCSIRFLKTKSNMDFK